MASSPPPPPSTELIHHLHSTLLDLSANPYPEIPNPPGNQKRASVALIIRIQPHYAHWPAPREPTSRPLRRRREPAAVADQLDAFFAQDWVRHGDPEVLFIKRAARAGDRWTSHVALPGGRRDPEDADDRAAAVREAMEEVGVDLSHQAHAIPVGNLPQRVVTTSWGKVPLMVLCPYIFLLTQHDNPPLRLQPTEVASTHWVSLRALLAPAQRTHELQDVSNRLAKQDVGLRRWFLRAMLGRMLFAAIRLIPSESHFCSSTPGFIPEGEGGRHRHRSGWQRWWSGTRAAASASAPEQPLLLWGLTLGVVADLLELLPPHDALDLWEFPTFTPWDVRVVLWAMSYRFRRRKRAQLAQCYATTTTTTTMTAPVLVEEGLDAVPAPSTETTETMEMTPTVYGQDGKPGEAGIGGLGVGRYYGEIRRTAKGSRSSAVSTLLEGYYDIVQKAVVVALAGRVAVVALIVGMWYSQRGG